jgi:mannose-6-phosphate isomerase
MTLAMAVPDHIAIPLKMKNPIQAYAWGSRTAIPNLLGKPGPHTKPVAELWMGAHPSAPSMVWCQERWQALDQLILEYPDELLGKSVARQYGPSLPFLFKVLAAGQPLSIQAHPDKVQAESGFMRENADGTDLAAPQRNYKDSNHKPECLCALTPFVGLCGFRSLAEMMSLMGTSWPKQHNHLLTILTKKGISSFFSQLMQLPPKKRLDLVAACLRETESMQAVNAAFSWIHQLNQSHGGDIGVLAPLFLNVVELQPGEAIFLPARQLHAYLKGMGIEIMANSDNVLRGGLTTKHIDVPELLNILDFMPYEPELLRPDGRDTIEKTYPSPAEEFALSSLATTPSDEYPLETAAISILFCTQGTATLNSTTASAALTVHRGESVLIPAAARGVILSGSATLYKATVNPLSRTRRKG